MTNAKLPNGLHDDVNKCFTRLMRVMDAVASKYPEQPAQQQFGALLLELAHAQAELVDLGNRIDRLEMRSKPKEQLRRLKTRKEYPH